MGGEVGAVAEGEAVADGVEEGSGGEVLVALEGVDGGPDGVEVVPGLDDAAVFVAGDGGVLEGDELDKLPKRVQAEARQLLTQIPYAPTHQEATKRRDQFAKRFRTECPDAVDILERDWDRMVTFYDFPEAHWQHLRTTNVVESPFASVRLRTDAAKRYKKVANATALIWRVLMVAEKLIPATQCTASHG